MRSRKNLRTVLAYVFWHRPRAEVDRDGYEAALARFHESLANPSAAFRLDRLPFGGGEPGYEDWYLVEDWTALGELNARAVDAEHRPAHDAPAGMSGHGWGGVYALLRGPAEPPPAARWQQRAPDEPAAALWQRQMVLGPAPEFCVVDRPPEGRVPIGASRSS
jgi:hypothetical protein